MTAGKANIYIEKYAKWSAVIELYQDVNKTIPVRLTGYSNPRMQIRENANSGILLSPNVEILDVNNGTLTASITATQSATVPTTGDIYSETTKCTYDILIDDPSGEPVRVFNGIAEISPGVTK